MRASLPESAEGGVPWRPLVWLTFDEGPGVAGLGLFGHAAADGADVIEELRGGHVDVPFAGEIGVVPGRLHLERPMPRGVGAREVVFRVFLREIRVPLPAVVVILGGFPKVRPGDQHGPTGDANGGTEAALIVGMGEKRPLLSQTIEIRRLELRIEQPDGRVVLIIGDDEENVGLSRVRGGIGNRGQSY